MADEINSSTPPLPNGVVAAQPAVVAPAQPILPAQPAAAPIEAEVPVKEEWDWLQIGAGVVIMTLFFFGVYYFRYKTTQYPKDLQDLEDKTSTLESEITALKNPQPTS